MVSFLNGGRGTLLKKKISSQQETTLRLIIENLSNYKLHSLKNYRQDR